MFFNFLFLSHAYIEPGFYYRSINFTNKYSETIMLPKNSVLVFHTKLTDVKIKVAKGSSSTEYIGTASIQVVNATSATTVTINSPSFSARYYYYTVFSYDKIARDCSTFDVFNGYETFFNIFGDKTTGNITRTVSKTTCMLFASPANVNYNFFVYESEEKYDVLSLYDAKGALITSISGTDRKELQVKTVFMKWKDDNSLTDGTVALEKTTLVEKNKVPSQSFNNLCQGDYSYKHTSYAGSETSGPLKQADATIPLKTGDYIEYIPYIMPRRFEFNAKTIFVCHNSAIFSAEASMAFTTVSILGNTGIAFFNFTQEGILTISSTSIYENHCAFSVFSYENISQCDTFDIWSGTSTHFNIFAGDKTGNVTQANNQHLCLLFSSADTLNYNFYASGTEKAADVLYVYDVNGQSYSSISGTNTSLIRAKTAFMRWSTSKSRVQGSAGLLKTTISTKGNIANTNNKLLQNVTRSYKNSRYAGRETAGNFTMGNNAGKVYTAGDYSIDYYSGLTLNLPAHSLIIFHNPSGFLARAKLSSRNSYTNILGTNSPGFNFTEKGSVTFTDSYTNDSIYFTVFQYTSELGCATFDVWSGSSTHFNILSAKKTGNITMTNNQKVCVLFTSPDILTYTFFVNGTEINCDFLTLYDVYGNQRAELTGSTTSTFTNNSILMKWSSDLYYVQGSAGLFTTSVHTYSQQTMPRLNSLIRGSRSYKEELYAGSETEGNFPITPVEHSFYKPGDYAISCSNSQKLYFKEGSLVVFHTKLRGTMYTLNDQEIYEQFNSYVANFTTSGYFKTSSSAKYIFTVYNYSSLPACDTFDIWAGTRTHFNIFSASRAGNITMRNNQSVCVLFASPEKVKYTFFSNDIESYDKIYLYTLENNIINSISSKNSVTISAVNSLLMKWKSDLSTVKGDAGLYTTVPLSATHSSSQCRNEFIKGPNSFKDKSYAGLETAGNYTKEITPGDYKITISASTTLNFNAGSTVVFHNPSPFSGKTSNGASFLGTTGISYVNFTTNGYVNITPKSYLGGVAYYTVIKYKTFSSLCDTFDIWSGGSTHFNILHNNRTGNVTMSDNQKICVLFSSANSMKYSFFADRTELTFDKLSIYNINGDLQRYISGVETSTYIGNSVVMRWQSDSSNSQGAAGMYSESSGSTIVSNQNNKLLKGVKSYKDQSYAGTETAGKYTSNTPQETYYGIGDYQIYVSGSITLNFKARSTVVFHNPSSFSGSTSEGSSILGTTGISYANFTTDGFVTLTPEAYHGDNVYFTVINYTSFSCSTFDIWSGGSTHFNILYNNRTGNVTMSNNQNICVLFSSTTLMRYTFFVDKTETNYDKLYIYDINGTSKKVLSGTGTFIYDNTSVIMQWMSDTSNSQGAAGMNSTYFESYPAIIVNNRLLKGAKSYKDQSYAGTETAGAYIMQSGSTQTFYSTGEHNAYVSSEEILYFYGHSLVIFHNPSYFTGEVHVGYTTTQILGAKAKYYNFTSSGYIIIKATKPTRCFFTVYMDDLTTGPICNTLDIYDGDDTFFNILADRTTGNITQGRNQRVCIFFTSAHKIKYDFFTDKVENTDYVEIYDINNTQLKRLTETDNFTTISNSVLFYWCSDGSVSSGAAGLFKTKVYEYNEFRYLNYTNALLSGFWTFKRSAYAGSETEGSYIIQDNSRTYFTPGDYTIQIDYMSSHVFTFPASTIVVVHNPSSFSSSFSSMSVLGSTGYSVFNITKEETFTIRCISSANNDISFSVFSYSGMGCSTMDVFNGYSTKFIIGSSAHNMTMSTKQNACFLFSSPFVSNYEFFTNGIGTNNRLTVYNINGESTVFGDSQIKILTNKTFLMKWKSDTSKVNGNAGLRTISPQQSSSNSYVNALFSGVSSITGSSCFNSPTAGYKIVTDDQHSKSGEGDTDYKSDSSNISYLALVIILFIVIGGIVSTIIYCLSRKKRETTINDVEQVNSGYLVDSHDNPNDANNNPNDAIPSYGIPPTAPVQNGEYISADAATYSPTMPLYYSPEAVSPENPYGLVTFASPYVQYQQPPPVAPIGQEDDSSDEELSQSL